MKSAPTLVCELRRSRVELVAIAWVFVAFRYVHSVIHVTYNRVRHRFTVYVLGCLVLWLLWGKLAIDLLR